MLSLGHTTQSYQTADSPVSSKNLLFLHVVMHIGVYFINKRFLATNSLDMRKYSVALPFLYSHTDSTGSTDDKLSLSNDDVTH